MEICKDEGASEPKVRGFFFESTNEDGVGRTEVRLEGPRVSALLEPEVYRGATRFYLVPVPEGESTEGAVSREAERLQAFFAIDRELSRMTASGERISRVRLPMLLSVRGFKATGAESVGEAVTSEWRLERPGRLPVVISSRESMLRHEAGSARRTVNGIYVHAAELSGRSLPSARLLQAIERIVARLDRPEAEALAISEERFGPDLEVLP